MDKKTARSLLMDFLYDEVSPDEKEELIAYLENHPQMMEELKELRKMQKIMQQMPAVEKSANLRIVETRKRSFGEWLSNIKMLIPKTGWGRTTLATAACLLFLLIVGSVARVQISSSQAGFTLSFGYSGQNEPIAQTVSPKIAVAKNNEQDKPELNKNVLTEKEADRFLTDKEAKVLLAKLYEQNKQLLTAFAEEMNKQDQQQLQKVVKYFQAQRVYDLKRIKKGLNQTQLANAYRWQQTNQVLGKFIEASVKN